MATLQRARRCDPAEQRHSDVGVERCVQFYLIGPGHKVPLATGRVLTLGDCAVGAAAARDRTEPILDPRTLEPVKFGGTAVVIAEEAFAADWLTTAAVVLGPKKTVEVLQRDGRRFFFMPPVKNP